MSAADYLLLMSAKPSRGPGPHAISKSAKRANLEEALHRECFAWVQAHERRWPILKRMFHPANGGARSKGEAGKLKAMGVRPGVPDFLLPLPNAGWAGLAVELKSPIGEISASQAEWCASLTVAGYLVGVARTLDEFIRLVSAFLGTPE